MEINQYLGILIKFLVSDFVDLISAFLLQDINSWDFVLVFFLKAILQEFPPNHLAVICKVKKREKIRVSMNRPHSDLRWWESGVNAAHNSVSFPVKTTETPLLKT